MKIRLLKNSETKDIIKAPIILNDYTIVNTAWSFLTRNGWELKKDDTFCFISNALLLGIKNSFIENKNFISIITDFLLKQQDIKLDLIPSGDIISIEKHCYVPLFPTFLVLGGQINIKVWNFGDFDGN